MPIVNLEASEGLPPIAVIVPSSGLARYLHFELALEGLWLSNGSSIGRMQGPAIAANLNSAIRTHVARDTGFFFFQDDDHKFMPQLAIRLARHNVPVVVALTLLSRPPFTPTIYKGATTDEQNRVFHHPYSWEELDGKSGLLPVYACGRAGLMVRKDVLDKLGDPWWRMGQINPDEANEDFDFCARLRALDIPIVCDMDTVLGHMSPCIAWPTLDAEGRWVVKFEWENGRGFTMQRK